jgi:hypothetical protein
MDEGIVTERNIEVRPDVHRDTSDLTGLQRAEPAETRTEHRRAEATDAGSHKSG